MVQHLNGQHIGVRVFQFLSQFLRQMLLYLDAVHTPDHRCFMPVHFIYGGEVQCYEWGKRPVQQPGRKSMVLRQRHPMPERIDMNRIAVSVLSEVPEERLFAALIIAAEPP
jgi:hypothetical protein